MEICRTRRKGKNFSSRGRVSFKGDYACLSSEQKGNRSITGEGSGTRMKGKCFKRKKRLFKSIVSIIQKTELYCFDIILGDFQVKLYKQFLSNLISISLMTYFFKAANI